MDRAAPVLFPAAARLKAPLPQAPLSETPFPLGVCVAAARRLQRVEKSPASQPFFRLWLRPQPEKAGANWALFPRASLRCLLPRRRLKMHAVLWRRLRALALNCVLALAATSNGGVGLPAALAADRVAVTQAHLAPSPNNEGIALYAQFDFELPFVLEDAINRGIALYFAVDFEMFRSRWYWFDKKVVDQTLTYRLSYSPLTRQYRLGRGTLAQPFDNLHEALDTLKRVSGWRVIDKGLAQSEADLKGYYAQMRLRLDTAQLPKPFQVAALTHSDWALASDWYALDWAPAVTPTTTASTPPTTPPASTPSTAP